MVQLLDTILIGDGDFGQAGGGNYSGAVPFEERGGWKTFSERRVRIDPSNAHDAFDEAFARLPAAGGTLRVSAGSANYNFAQISDWNKPARIIWDRGSTITKPTNSRTCARLLAPIENYGLRATGAINADTPIAQSFIEVGDTTDLEQGSECGFYNCTFIPLQQANNVQQFFAVRVLGLAPQLMRAVEFDHCKYIVRAGTANAWAWVGEETSGQGTNEWTGVPYGCGFIKAQDCRQLSISHCKIVGLDTAAGQVMGTGIVLDDCVYTSITGLLASDFDTQASSGTDHASPLVVIRGVNSEGGHTIWNGGFVENAKVRAVGVFDDPRWVKVMNVEHGRSLGTVGAFTFKSINDGETLQLMGCSSHNVTGPAASGHRFCDVDGVENFLLAHCAATFRQDDNDPFLITGVKNPVLTGNMRELQ